MVPVISVMIPCYNASTSLPMALSSLLAQTYTNWECLLIDDGSSDDPISVANVLNDNRIRCYRFTQNQGRAIARQKALDLARGEYLCMLDADDWIYPWKLEKQIEIMKANPELAVLSSGLAIVDADNNLHAIRIPGSEANDLYIYPPLAAPKQVPIAHAPAILRMSIAKQYTYDPEFRLVEDAEYLLKILLNHPFGVHLSIFYAYNEFDTITLEKTVKSIIYSRRIFYKYRKTYPRASYSYVAISFIKELLHRLAFSTGLNRQLFFWRHSTPTIQDVKAFYKARDIVYQTLQTHFPNSPLAESLSNVHVK